jgi:hypothetical protein
MQKTQLYCFCCNFKIKMTPFENQQLWEKIKNFPLDEADAQLTFSDRLARENGWDKNYTQRVIDEYKKFIYLCCISPSAVTPSDPVDQVWHLHLTYTKSYWKDFCGNTLKKEIHHTPTKGGKDEQEKFNDYYSGLHQVYTEAFETPPPPDIWQDNTTRFSDINFQRVNLGRYWKLKKPTKRTRKAAAQLIPYTLTLLTLFLLAGLKAVIGFIIMTGIFQLTTRKKGNKGNGGSSGCFAGSCIFDASVHHDSGCSSDNGCSSGCSGCGGGCGGCGGGD